MKKRNELIEKLENKIKDCTEFGGMDKEKCKHEVGTWDEDIGCYVCDECNKKFNFKK